MLHDLGWCDLKDCRRDFRLALLYKIVTGHVAINDNYRVRSWRSDAINYYITYCQIADLKLLTEN